VRALAPEELRAAHDLFGAAIHRPPSDEDLWQRRRDSYSPGRTWGVVEPPAGRLVATTTSFPTRTAVPGGAVLPLAAVTRVGVRADRTRRGLLTALMRAQLDDLRARGDALALLWASEAAIYGRFGYGVATRGRAVRVRASRAPLRPGAQRGGAQQGGAQRGGAQGDGAVRLLDRAEAPAVLADLHDALALRRPGGIARPRPWWALTAAHYDRGPLLAAVHTGPGGDDGFALAVPSGEEFAATLRVTDLHAADVAATAGLWRFLLGVDLVEHVQAAMRPLDEPLDLLLAHPRDCSVTAVADETWLRLVDLPAALAARAFPAGGRTAAPVLLAVHDPLLPDNAGVYRLGDGTAERVGPLGARPVELECDVAALAMAYLGDRAPSALAATGWWTVHDPAAVPRADALFATDVAPWCGTHF
jgi:predicted acetyltransferase